MADALPARRVGRREVRRPGLAALLSAAAAAALSPSAPAAIAQSSPTRGDGSRTLVVGSEASRRAVFSNRLPRRAWALSFELGVAPGGILTLELGRGARLTIRRGASGRMLVELSGARRLRVRSARRGRWGTVQLQARRGAGGSIEVAFGPTTLSVPGRGRGLLVVRVRRGAAVVGVPLVTALRDGAGLLLHRLLALDARVPPRRFLVGADLLDRLHFKSRSWTRGFLAGALWQAGALVPGLDRFERAALRRTRATFGYETADSHDVGFVYENSSVAAYRRLCRRASRPRGTCAELLASGLDAADRLLELAGTNLMAGTIPTRATWPSPLVADTIVDSMMNLPLLYWASDVTGDPTYRDLAARHAQRVAELLVRRDGSTAQSVHFDRVTGRVLGVHAHQGLSVTSTWARGQAWAVYGFTTSAAALRDRAFLRVAERTAAWVADHVRASGVPPWDYDFPLGEPVDTSAGVITAAGALRLARLCERWTGACEQPGRWRPLGLRLLRGALAHVSRSAPLGYLGQQVGTFGGHQSWDDDAELVFGLRYALEAVRLSR
jgi:Glycosyl Hydrolase Family 88